MDESLEESIIIYVDKPNAKRDSYKYKLIGKDINE